MTRARNTRPKWCCSSFPRPHEAWEWGADCSTICLAYSMTPACANTSCSPTAHAMSVYDHRGLIRKAERDDRNDGSSRPNPTDSSSSGLTVGTTSLLADDEPMSYFLYEGRC